MTTPEMTMSKHSGLDQNLRKFLTGLKGAQRTEALECLGVQTTTLDDYYAAAAQVLADARELTSRPRHDSMTDTQQFAAVTA